MSGPLVHDEVPGLIDFVGRYVTNVNLASDSDLAIWLPGLDVPPDGWSTAGIIGEQTPTRLAVHGTQTGGWDACAILNLWAFTGWLPTNALGLNIACTLRAAEAENISVYPLPLSSTPPSFDVTAASAQGEFTLSDQVVHGRYFAMLVQSGSGGEKCESPPRGALLEHNTFISPRADDKVRRDLAYMSDAVVKTQMRVLMSDPSPTASPSPSHTEQGHK